MADENKDQEVTINQDGSLSPKIIVKDDDKLKELAQSMPQVVPDAVAAAEEVQTQENTLLEKLKDAKDNKDRPFNPELHEYDAKTGEPIRTTTGRFKLKPRKIRIPDGMTATGQVAPVQIDPLRVEAEKYADMFIVGGMGFVGDEFKAGEGEREGLILSWHAIFQKYGVMPIHPIAGVFIAHSLYIFRRADKPRTKSILEKAFTSVKFFFINLWMKLQGKDYKVAPKDEVKK